MNRRIWTAVGAGVLSAAVLLMVGFAAFNAGRDDEVATREVDGEVVRVVGDHHWGPGPGFFLFPLFVILLVLFLVRRRPWGNGHRYGSGYWHRYGWHGGPNPPPPPAFEEWHRRAHEAEGQQGDETTAQSAPTPPPAEPPRDG